MREATYYVAVSLDGCIAAPDGSFDAFPTEGDHMDVLVQEYTDALPGHVQDAVGIAADLSRFDTVLMGWSTYTPILEVGLDSPYPHLRQYVASSRERELPAAIERTADPLETLRALKAEDTGSGIYIAGGGRLAGSVVDEIDRFVFKVNPVRLGAGIPVLAPGPYAPRRLELVSSRPFRSGVVINEYVPRR